ncbi:MAG TPA: serine hydrolase domain-containing protein [Mycobacteriales bacterium]|nr:serine hydrolase domain-containing protein [Mycobacteriales bacterium]
MATVNSAWTVAPGYEAVRDAFVAGSGSLGYGGGAYCAYVNGQPVVDLWGGDAAPGRPWQEQTTTVLMSATKGFAVLCMQILVERGQIDVDAPVATYWPEFAANGKEGVLVRHLLMHTAGVIGFDGMHNVVRHDATGWDDYEGIAAGLAASAPSFPPGTTHCYHALTIGWLFGEIVRRVDGRTLGRFFAEEVAGPLGLEAWVGTPDAELGRAAQVRTMRLEHLPSLLRKMQETYLAAARRPETLAGRAFLGDGTQSGVDVLELIFNSPAVLRAEFPAGGGTATARGMAKLWAAMAHGGELDGVRILKPDTVDAWGHVVSRQPDQMLVSLEVPRLLRGIAKAPLPRTLGYLGNTAIPGIGYRFGPNPEAFGAEGLGGQFGFCDRQSNIAVGFVRSELAVIDVLQAGMTNVLYDCARHAGLDVYTPPKKSLPGRAGDRALGGYMRRRVAVPAPV